MLRQQAAPVAVALLCKNPPASCIHELVELELFQEGRTAEAVCERDYAQVPSVSGAAIVGTQLLSTCTVPLSIVNGMQK